MKRPIALLVLLTLPVLLNAANCYIWHFDSLDRFYESAVGDSVECPYWIEQTLGATGHTYTTGFNLPANLDPYDIVFVTLGWFRC